jgi:hypothetical protein
VPIAVLVARRPFKRLRGLNNRGCATVVVQGVRRGNQLNRNSYMIVTAMLFLVVALLHLLRIIFGWPVKIGGFTIPFWASWVAVLGAGALVAGRRSSTSR